MPIYSDIPEDFYPRPSDINAPLRSTIGIGPRGAAGHSITADMVDTDPYGYFRVQFKDAETGEVLVTTPNLDVGSRFFVCSLPFEGVSEGTPCSATVSSFSTLQASSDRGAIRVGDLVFFTARTSNETFVTLDTVGIGVVNSVVDTSVAFIVTNIMSARVADDGITTDMLANLCVTTAKIADGAITNAKIADNAVDEDKIAASAVTTDKIDNGAVITAKLHDEAVTNAKLGNSSVTNVKIANGEVITSKLANNAVTEEKIGSDAVTTSKINDSAVTSRKLAPGSVTPEKFNANVRSFIDDLTQEEVASWIESHVEYIIPSDEQAETVITEWLEEHPEATTSIPDRGVSPIKTTFIEPKNLLNPNKIDTGMYYSPSAGEILHSAADNTNALIGLIAVTPGQTYVLQGTAVNYSGGFFDFEAEMVLNQRSVSTIQFDSQHRFTVPSSGVYYVAINLNKQMLPDGTYQLEKGTTPSPIVPYESGFKLDKQYIPDDFITKEMIGERWIEPPNTTFFEAISHNLINPTNINMLLYYSPAANILKPSGSLAYAVTGMIEVEEGETYTYSGSAADHTGGYFAENAETVSGQEAISKITFVTPVSGGGKCFTVPVGQGIKYVCLDLKRTSSPFEIDGDYQLEKGEMATPIRPYAPEWKIVENYLPDSRSAPADFNAFDKLPIPSYEYEESKLSKFFRAMSYKNEDVVIVGTGTSLTARSSEHCTLREDAMSRPPLMHSYNFASLIWDRIKWEGQEYRRFDYPQFFVESGSWSSNHEMPEWDDGPYRYGITRHASGVASFGFEIPVNAWSFNLIYRTDSVGTQAATVSVSEGNGVLEVYNGSEWVEANGFVFSELETPEYLTNIFVNNPNTENNSTVQFQSYQISGNTTYQKRLKMRCKSETFDSRSISKSVTISSSTGRLMYWGVEWSPREFMITYINSARGSHNMTYNNPRSLSHYQDNEVWQFKPTLIFTENPIHNSGASGAVPNSYYTNYWGYATYDFFFNPDNPISFVSRAQANNISDLEWVIFTSSITYNFHGIDENGNLVLYEDKNGKVMTALDAQEMCYSWVKENEESVISINACKYWCDAAFAIYGNLKAATIGSGKDGSTMTNEGSHWNNTGSKIMDRCIGQLFNNYN